MKGVLLIATRKYKRFIPEIVTQIDRHFLPTEEIGIMIFADEPMYPRTTKRVTISYQRISELGFPLATLYRYRIFSGISEYLKKFSHLLYLDVDMAIEQDIHSEEMFGDGLTAVLHPGCYKEKRWGSPNTDSRSTAYLEKDKQQQYVCGGVQGGATDAYLQACHILSANISEDEKNGVMAEWHDETHWNKYISEGRSEVKILSPAYCMPETRTTQELWGLSEFVPKIIALNKNHAEMRS